jgi:hypothetical protein
MNKKSRSLRISEIKAFLDTENAENTEKTFVFKPSSRVLCLPYPSFTLIPKEPKKHKPGAFPVYAIKIPVNDFPIHLESGSPAFRLCVALSQVWRSGARRTSLQMCAVHKQLHKQTHSARKEKTGLIMSIGSRWFGYYT